MRAEDVERLHEASLRILDEVGVRLEHDAIVQRVRAAGARPGRGPHDVRLSPRDALEVFARSAGHGIDDVRPRHPRAGGREPRLGPRAARVGDGLSLAQLVIDDEMIAYVRRHRRGFAVDDASRAPSLSVPPTTRLDPADIRSS